MTRRFSCLFICASLLTAGSGLHADLAPAALLKAVVVENNVAYLCVGQVADKLAAEISAAQRAPATTNKIIGTVLDLRFADGSDLAAAKATANLFAAKKLPLAILVNGQTRDAAATLAADLRAARYGLVFGSAAADLQPDIAGQSTRRHHRRCSAGNLRSRPDRPSGNRATARFWPGLTVSASRTATPHTVLAERDPRDQPKCQNAAAAFWHSSLMRSYAGGPMHSFSGVDTSWRFKNRN